MKKILSIILSISILFSVTAILSVPATASAASKTGKKYVTYKTINKNIKKNGTLILKVKAKYPHLKSKSKAAKKVNKFFANQIKKDIKEIKKLAEKDYSNINKNSSDYYKYNENIKLTYNKKNKYSFKSNCSGYTGGVHGYSSVTGYNFSKQTGKKIPNSKLTKYSDKALKKKIVNKVKAKINKNPKNYFDNALQTVKNCKINKFNVWLDAKYLYVYFNEYELSSYANGPTQIKIKL